MPTLDNSRAANPDRRGFMLLGVGAFVAAAAPMVRRRRSLVRRNVPVMGTLAEIAVVHGDRAYAHRAIDAAVAELRHVQRTMSRFEPSSDVGRANAAVVGEPVAISPATAIVLGESVRWAVASNGRFDPCYGRAVELWDVTARRAPPLAENVRRMAGRQLFRALELDVFRGRPIVRLTEGDAAIDLGGVAKGFGVDRAVATLREWNIHHGLVNVGGDLYALGGSEDGDPWRIGIRSAADPTVLDGTFELTDAAVATSGDYLRFFTHRGQRYHHLLNPATGEPHRSEMHSVSVTASSCMRADAAATTLFGMERDKADRLLGLRAPDARTVSLG